MTDNKPGNLDMLNDATLTAVTPAIEDDTPSRERPTKSWSRRALAAVAIMLTVGIASVTAASSASAATIRGAGSAGTVSVPKAQARASWEGATMTLGQRTVTESPAARPSYQYACMTTRLFRLKNGPFQQSWVLDQQAQNCAWISPAATSVVMPATTFRNLLLTQAYSVDVSYSWQLSNGYLLGTTNSHYNHASDYVCNTPGRCSAITTSVGGALMINF